MDQRLHAVVRGRVQGVSFRYETLRKANQLGVTGWVRNRPDGSVEVMAEGDRGRLNRLLDFLWQGPPAARVSEVETHWFAATGAFENFEVE
jgi:acylphosphatase